MERLRGIYILDEESFDLIYGPAQRAQIRELVDIISPFHVPSTRALELPNLQDVDVIFSGWGGPVLDAAFLAKASRLKAFFYGAGSLGTILTPEVWSRKIAITTASAANAIPVAEYCLGVILFSLKHGWQFARMTRKQRTFPFRPPVPGAYGATIGLVSLGMAARSLRKLLTAFDLKVLAYDPFVTASEAKAINVQLAPLDELFARSDVVSIHTPLLDETRGLITGEHVGVMKHGATLINTARGDVVRQSELISVLKRRPDVQAILDVTSPEPPLPDSELFDLENVVLTPHIAGSRDHECQRMGQAMVEELKLYLAGKPLRWALSPELVACSIHRPSKAATHPQSAPAKPAVA